MSAASLCHVAWAQVLARVSGRDDVVFGTVLFGRMQGGERVDRAMGMFINTLPIRIRIGEESAQEIVRQTHTLLAQLLRHEHAPLSLAQRCSTIVAPAPLFTALLNYRHSAGADHGGGEQLRWEGIEKLGSEERTNYPLILNVDDFGEGFGLKAQAQWSVEPERVCAYMETALERLVEALEEEPATPARNLDVLPEPERDQLLVKWNETEREYGETRSVAEMIAEQATRRGEAIAVVSEQGAVSYRELNRRANQLANYLGSRGIGKEDLVGICADRSVEMVIAILGVLKAGAAYVPIDPADPRQRIEGTMEDAQVKLLLTQEQLVDRLAAQDQAIVCLDRDWDRIGNHRHEGATDVVRGEGLAYVIYTSGSTGRPKGVMNTHLGIRNRLLWMQEKYELDETDRVLQKTTFSFDVSVWEFLWPLMTGAALVMARPGGHRDSEYLLRVIKEEEITTIHFVPSMLGVFLEEEVEEAKSLRRVICSGEALTKDLEHRLRSRTRAQVSNLYGPTEAAIDVTYWISEGEGEKGVVPIGRPISNIQMYVLDGEMEPTPVGVRGEIYISGIGLARGYIRRPELTGEKFIPHRFSREAGERMYRTGDLGRYLSDGNIEFIGRADEQVKIRGYRIELGEIEAVLNEYPLVRRSVVVAREDEAGGKRLIGYVVGEVSATAAELNRHVRERLPEYMVPRAILILEEMPVTASGKIDRKRLPSVKDVGAGEEREYVAARTPAEEILAGIFEEVLKLDRIGIRDNFFELGGHSLLATQVVSRVRKVFGVEIGVRSVFEEPRAEGLARRVEEAMRSGEMGAPPLVRVSREGNLPLSFAQQRLWFLDQLEPGNTLYNIPGGVRLEGRLNLEALDRVINEIVRRHEVLRTRFEVVDGEPIQVINKWEPQRLELTDLTGLTQEEKEEEARRIAIEEAETSFDLSRGPLLKVKVLKLGDERHVVFYTLHHIVSDEWLMRILIEEVGELYRAYSEGESSPLDELEIQYADFAMWQRQWLRGEALERQLSYWRNQLAGLEPLTLPTDHPRPAVANRHRGVVHFSLSAEATLQLVQLSRREGTTLFMTLLAGFQLLLSRYCGQQDVAVGTDVANRNRAETEGVIGFFVNPLVLRTDLSGASSFRELLKRVREVTLGAYANQDLPFERLVEELQPERGLGSTPLFQVGLVFNNAPREKLRLKELSLEGTGTGTTQAKHDLTLFVGESGAGLSGAMEYARELFEESMIIRLTEHLRVLLERTTAHPEKAISEIECLSQAELDQILHHWNDTSRAYPTELCIHELIERQVEKTPHAIALTDGERCLSYEELGRSANRLAHYLRTLGVGPDVTVALCVNRSLEMVVALMGILKAGGAYVPIDPKYPVERMAFMLEDAEAAVLLTEEGLRTSLPESQSHLVSLDGAWKEIPQFSDASPKTATQPGHLAYVIYTSGSTGKPKGVMVNHQSLVNYVHAITKRLEMTSSDRVLQFASISFDVAVEEIFPTLATGGVVVIDVRGVAASFIELERTLMDEQISWIELPTAYWQAWVADLAARQGQISRSMRQVIVGGERMSPKSVLEWTRTGVPMLHIYGLTETTITTSLYQVGDERQEDEIPIGRPIENTQVYILDGGLRVAPVGVGGELYIAGEGVARGYIRQAGQTAERFVPNPYGKRAGERMYRTGDKVKYLEDGRMVFLGRVDDQVKVRGYRVEMGEIVAALKSHPATEEAVVTAVEDGSGSNKLIAYVVPKYEYRSSIDQNGATAGSPNGRTPELWPAQGEYGVFDEVLYYAMTNDQVRNRSYEEAMRRLVRGKTVVDVGTGADAILSRLCIKAGARKVYAIEMGEEAYRKASRVIESEGLEDKIILIHGESAGVELPEKVDVCISELIGTIGSAEGAAPILNDARRLLKADGVMIPERCLTKIAGVELPEEIRRDMAFTEVSGYYANKVFEKMGRMFDLRLCIRNFPKRNLITSIDLFEEIDFNGNIGLGCTREIFLRINRKARLEGLLLWINLEVVEGEVIDVLEYDGCWSPAYMPVFSPGIEVEEGDEIHASCSVIYGNRSSKPDYRLKGALIRRSGKEIEFDYYSRLDERSYKGSEFYRQLLSGDEIRISKNGKGESVTRRLENHLSEILPEYMAPAAIVIIDRLPLTANGKVDRKALPRPELKAGGRENVAPRNAVEEILVGIFAEVLKIDGVGIDDNFFELGGHSLLATQVISRVTNTFGVEIGVRSVFEKPTVEGLASRIEKAINAGAKAEAPPLVKVSREGRLPLSFAQQRLWFIDQMEPGNTLFNVPGALRLEGNLNLDALERCVNEIVRRHEVLRTRFEVEAGEPAQVIEQWAPWKLEVDDLTSLPQEEREEEAGRIAREEAKRSFDLSRGPLLRVRVLKLGEELHMALYTMHHIVSDEWLMGVMLREMREIYEAMSEGRESPLPELEIQYADYAVWQRNYLTGRVMENEVGYWKEQLNGVAIMELPTDYPRPAAPSYPRRNREGRNR